MFKAIIAVLVITIVLIISFSVIENIGIAPPDENGLKESEYAEKDSFEITLSGEVKRPGTYLVRKGDQLSDALEAAGGLTSNGDARSFNSSFLLEAKLSFYIAPLFDLGDVCASEPLEKANINSASKERLLAVTFLSSSQADSLISYRLQTPFERIEEIQNVTGIGPATWEKAKDHIILRD